MNQDIQTRAEQLNSIHRRKSVWYRILSVLVCIAVFVTTYAMILPAITLETTDATYCGLEAHIHTDECYETPGVPEHKVIDCEVQKNLHTHTDECYGDDGSLTCGLADYIVHTHISGCFNDDGELICTLEEQSEHTHTDDCYSDGKLICGKTKAVYHQHTDDCMKTVAATKPQGLICTRTEHTHTNECFVNPIMAASLAASNEIQPGAKTDGSVSDAITDKSTMTSDSGAQIGVSAYSDKSTSNIEDEFLGSMTADGKVLTDKSVVFGKDDYAAFTTYDNYTFSVVLSALGQQYENMSTTIVRIPLDVVFILDTSGSMITDGKSRGSDAVATLNELASYVMELNENNRFGVATFSSTYDSQYANDFDSNELLPIGSYSNAKNSNILTYTAGTSRNDYYDATVKVNTSVSGTSSSNETNFYGGTYTTAGLYEAAQMLTSTDASSRTVKENGKEVQRIPIVILITDGDVTYSSNGSNKYEYSSRTSGSGNSMSNDQLFYTILSAYHYKSQISDAYFDNAKMYTIGIGDDAVSGSDLQTVLNPTADNIANLDSTYSTAQTNLQNGTNFPSAYTRQYGTEFQFCDGTYSTETFNPELTSKIKSFVRENAGEYIYSSSQKTSNDIVITDIIGDGMEISSGFVLRYDGTNYNLSLVDSLNGVDTYRYSGNTTVKANQYAEATPLSGITVRVDKTDGGNQRVTWHIPASLLPEYTHAKSDSWYYDMLPVRLLYKVGLTEESKKSVLDMTDSSGSLTFYTNTYTGGDNAVATIDPTEASGDITSNPYYKNYTGESFNKDTNTTATRATYREISSANGNDTVTIVMGNNGKLVFAVDTREPDESSAKTSLTVTKVWKDGDGNIITDASKLPSSVTAVAKADGRTYTTAELNSANGWTYTFSNLPTEWDDGSEIYWSVDENTVPDGYEKENIEKAGGTVSVSALEDGKIYIFKNANGYAIRADKGSLSAVQSDYTDTTIQWKAIKQSDGSFRLQNVSSGYYLGLRCRRSIMGNSSYTIISTESISSSSESTYYSYNWTLGRNTLSATAYNTRYISISGNRLGAATSGTTLDVSEVAPLSYTITNKEKSAASVTITKQVVAPDTDGTYGPFNFEISWDGGETRTFSLSNGESHTVTDIPVGAEITVKELNSDGFTVAFIKDGATLQSGASAYVFTADGDTALTVRNTTGVEMPETGSTGTHFFTYIGLTLMVGSIVAGIILRRRYKKEVE